MQTHTSDNILLFIDDTDPEFNYMFSQFEDPEMYNKEWGECLQYMGTVVSPHDEIWHEFRHRAVPKTNERKYWHIPASPNFKARYKTGNYKGSKF